LMTDKKRRFIFIIAAAVVLLIVIRTITGGSKGGAPRRGMGASAVSVRTEVLKKDSIASYLKINGRVKAFNQADVVPDQNGRLIRYFVEVGDTVRPGQRLALIDPSRPGQQYQPSPVIAPTGGVIIALPFELGNTVTTSTIVASVGDISRLKVEVYLPERFASAVTLGSRAFVTSVSAPAERHEAVVTQMAPVVDPQSDTIKTTLSLIPAAGGHRLLAGMYVELQIQEASYNDVFYVPDEIIVRRSDQDFIYVVNEDDQTAAMISVARVAVIDNMAVIEGEALTEGLRVVTAGQTLLSSGAAVRDISLEEQPAAGPGEESREEMPAEQPDGHYAVS
jgi:membrane fusion protein (multidrug efflux system)